MDCVFDSLQVGGKCPNCDQKPLKRNYEKSPRRTCRMRGIVRQAAICRHFGTDQIDTILILCETCTGRVHIKYPVHECHILGRCLPSWRGEPQEIQQCEGCPKYEPLPQQ